MDECHIDQLQAAFEQKRLAAAADHAPIIDDLKHRKRVEQISREMGPLTVDQFEQKRQESMTREQERQQWARVDRFHAFVARRGDKYGACRVGNYVVEHPEQHGLVNRLLTYCECMSDEIADGTNVILFGKMGTGKDHLLSAMARQAILQGKTLDWWNGMDLFGRVRDRMGDGDSEEAFVRTLARPDVLYISDPLPPGEESLTPFQMAFMIRVIDARYSRSKPIWISVNTTGRADFERRLGAAAVDRLCDGAVTFFCNWPSHRKPK